MMPRPALPAFIAALLLSAAASAQQSPTYVSGVGFDGNPCTRTAPCQTWAYALTQTAPGGEIDAEDPGDFGPVTITEAVTLDGIGVPFIQSDADAGTSLGTAITISAGSTDVVILRHMSINAATTNASAVTFLTGGELRLDDCAILGGTADGLDMIPTSGAAVLEMRRTTIRGAGGTGILLAPAAGASVTALLDQATLDGNDVGLSLGANTQATLFNPLIANNTSAGILQDNTSGTSEVNLDEGSIIGNGVGIEATPSDGTATTRLSDVTLYGNTTASTLETPGGSITSFGNSRIEEPTGSACASGQVQVVPSSLPTETIGTPVNVTFGALDAMGPVGFKDQDFAVPGLTFDNGVMTGTPITAGTYPVAITALDGDHCTGSAAISLRVVCQTITMSPVSGALADGTTGVDESTTFSGAGALGMTTYAISSGSLPPGVTLEPTGALSGYPTASGGYSFSITATDSHACQATGSYSQNVDASGTFQATTTGLTTSGDGTVASGSSLTLTATVSAAAATGTVTFHDGVDVLGTSTVSTGVATLTTALHGVGTHVLTATYSGDRTYGTSTSAPVDETVDVALTDTVLTVSGPSFQGDFISLEATVTSLDGIPDGTVDFKDGNTLIGIGQLDSSGAAVVSLSTLAVGMHSIKAYYLGNSEFGASTSQAVLQSVAAASFTVSVAEAPAFKSGTASANLLVTVSGDLGAPVSLACADGPATVACSFSPSSVPGASGATSVTVTFSTTQALLQFFHHHPVGSTVAYGWMLPLALLGFRRRRFRKALAAGAVLAAFALGACTASKNKTDAGAPGYGITVVATSGDLTVSTPLTVPAQ